MQLIKTVKRSGIVVALLLLTTGCSSLSSLANTLNERKVQSCLYYEGSIGPHMRLKGITATGGINLQDCGVER